MHIIKTQPLQYALRHSKQTAILQTAILTVQAEVIYIFKRIGNVTPKYSTERKTEREREGDRAREEERARQRERDRESYEGLTDTGGEGGVRDIADLTAAPVAAHGVQTVSVGTHTLQLALIKICNRKPRRGTK